MLGQELFPKIDSGQFVLRFRPPPGTNFEITRMMGQKILEIIEREVGQDKIDISIGYAGQIAPVYGLNLMITMMRGPDDGILRMAFKEGSGIELSAFREKMRKMLPIEISTWMAKVMESKGVPPEEAKINCNNLTFGFEPGDMVSNVMSFGSPLLSKLSFMETAFLMCGPMQ